MDQGFRRVDEREIYAGQVLRLVTATFEAPDGTPFDRDVVRTTGAVCVVPIVGDLGEPSVVLVAQYRPAHECVLIEIPAGMRDVEGESDEDNARRELEEEVGLAAGRIEPLAEVRASPGVTDAAYSLFLATECTKVERSPHGPEEQFAEVLEVTLEEAIGWIDDGRITDGKTVIGLLLADRRLRRE